MRFIESKAILVLHKRYVYSFSLLVIIITLLLDAFIDEDIRYIKEMITIIHATYVVSMAYGYLDQYKRLFMYRKSSYFIKNLFFSMFIQSLTGLMLNQLVIGLFFLLVALPMTILNKHFGTLSLIMYIVLSSQEVKVISWVRDFTFINHQIYVILIMVLLTCVSFLFYLYKEDD